MDALFFFRHSVHDDIELRYALRGIARHAPWIRKVWIFGDRPRFIVDDKSLIEVVPHEYLARVGKFRTPVTSFFLMFYLSSLIPDLDSEILWFCDDFFIIDELSIEDARKDRYIRNLDEVQERPKGLWQESLWRTYDFLKHLGYTGYNFEVHAPTYFTKRRILEAYCDFRDFVTEDRWYGMLGPTAILNHACCHGETRLVHRGHEGRWLGFYGKSPSYSDLKHSARGKLFLNVDDNSYTPDVWRLLKEIFPDPCRYEEADVTENNPVVTACPSDDFRRFSDPVLKHRNEVPDYLNQLELTGEAVEVGVLRGEYSHHLLSRWHGRRLHCVDPWQDFTVNSRYVDRNNHNQSRHDQNYAETVRKMSEFGERCQIHRLTSQQAADLFPDKSLDFVYLDAMHYREAVEQDLNLWAPKVRHGGILAGHDYLDGILPSGHFQVKSAVDSWAKKRNLTVMCTGENVWRSWLIEIV